MIELIVETGLGVPNANSLVSVEYANQYFLTHPYYAESWADLGEERKKALLISATRQVGALLPWPGQPLSVSQTLPWPRQNYPAPDGTYYAVTYVPDALLQAICEMAYWLSTPGSNPDAADASSGLEELRLDVITLKFAGSTVRRAVPMAVVRLLKGLGVAQSNPRVKRIQVGLA